MEEVTVYTDGACSQNGTWKGGWGYVILDRGGGIASKGNGSEDNTTNSRMEIKAVLEVLKAIKEPSEVTVVSDSAYVCNTINLWLDQWLEKGILETKSNADQWREYIELRKFHKSIKAVHIRGHQGNYFNEICDKLATGAIKGDYV